MRRGAEKDSERKTNSMFQANCNFLSPIFGPFRAPSKPSFYLKQGEAPVHLTVHNTWWWNFHSPVFISVLSALACAAEMPLKMKGE
jgi:hypothetical protein